MKSPISIGRAFDTYKEWHSAEYGAGAAILFLAAMLLGSQELLGLWGFLNAWVLFPFKTDKIAETLKMNVRGEEHYFLTTEAVLVILILVLMYLGGVL